MIIQNFINKVRTFLSEEVTLESVKTSDGTILSFEKLEVGSEIFVIQEDGVQVPAPDAEYVLEDGTVVKVVESKISEIVAPVEPVETPEEETPEVEVEIPVTPMSTEMTEYLSRIEKLEEIVLVMAEKMSKMKFTEELSVIKVEEPKIEKPILNRKTNLDNSPLVNILKNMYK